MTRNTDPTTKKQASSPSKTLVQDIQTLDNVPCELPLNDKEQAALDRCNALESEIGEMKFWEVCAKLNIPLRKFHSV